MYLQKTLIRILKQNPKPQFLLLDSSSCFNRVNSVPESQYRFISSTTSLNSWMDTIKGVFTGKKEGSKESVEAFTLTHFADALEKARKIGNFKQFVVGRSSDATFSDAFGRMGEILRYLGTIDPSGENIQAFHKQEAAKHCKCTVAEVESALSKFTWAKLAQMKITKLKEEGKPMPKSINEVQKLVGSTPLDIARSNLAESGQISRNAPCPCGSKKRYKWCCGKDK